MVASFASPEPFWSEGAAVTLQSDPTYFDSTAPVDNLELDAPQLNYSTAGHFSRWLIETHGIERFRELLRAPGSAREAFERSYAQTFEAAQAQYFAEAPSRYPAWLACDHPDLRQPAALDWAETLEIDCEQPDVRSTPLGIGAFRVLTISERGFYEITTTAESGVILRCPDDLPPELVALGDPSYGDVPPVTGGFARALTGGGEPLVVELVPGRYELGVGHAGHDSQTVTLEVRAASGPIPQTPESSP